MLPQVLTLAGRPQRRQCAARLLDFVGLSGMEEKRPEQLSGGEQQRASIAVALANEPLLLADEPTGEPDSQTARQIVSLLRDLNQTLGLTIILVTHDSAVAAATDRTIAIRDDRTSTETVRRERVTGTVAGHASATGTGSAVISLPMSTHREFALLDRAGRLQLPEQALTRITCKGRADLRIRADHVELWPIDTDGQGHTDGASASAVIGLPTDSYREAVVIDRVGQLQLSEDALDRVPFGRRAVVRITDDRVELWVPGRLKLLPLGPATNQWGCPLRCGRTGDSPRRSILLHKPLVDLARGFAWCYPQFALQAAGAGMVGA